uniref:Reverse transcriptase RNase H-like domain-containing protein n=1 Tax=Romanomermis culicivorax TaxID=13658 RepID=A0A915IBI8_ROMCU
MAYNSRLLTNAKTGYGTTERESLTIIYSFQMYHHYTYGQKAMLHTEIDANVNGITCAMTKKPITQLTLSDPVLLATDYTQPPVEAIALASQEEIKQVQAANPVIRKII